MACGRDLLSTLPAHLVDEISEADWAQEKGREQSCSLVGEFLAQQADFKQLIDQLTQPEGSPLEKYLDGADDWKKKGNEAFKIGAWQKAVDCYTKVGTWKLVEGRFGQKCAVAKLYPLYTIDHWLLTMAYSI
jgi:hypothetical protein